MLSHATVEGGAQRVAHLVVRANEGHHTHTNTHTHTHTHTHARTDTFPEPEPTSSTKAGTKCPRDTHIDTQTHTDTLPTHAQKVGVGAWGDKAGAIAPTPSLPVQTKVLPVRFDWRHYPKNRRENRQGWPVLEHHPKMRRRTLLGGERAFRDSMEIPFVLSG